MKTGTRYTVQGARKSEKAMNTLEANRKQEEEEVPSPSSGQTKDRAQLSGRSTSNLQQATCIQCSAQETW